jgi:ATP-binding cassette subfamily B protein
MEEEPPDKSGFSFLFKYLRPHKKFIAQLVLGLLVGSLLQLVFPFLTQAVVDVGVNTRNLNFIHLVLIAQVVLFISRMSVEFIRSWILLHVSTRINISLISDFLNKLMRLPIHFLSDTLITNYRKRLPFKQNMQGAAEIIIEDISLAERLIFPLKAILKDNLR